MKQGISVMTAPAIGAGERRQGSRRQFTRPRQWAVWELPRPVLGYVLFTEAVAITVTVLGVWHFRFDPAGVLRTGLLATCAVWHNEMARHVEAWRSRRGADIDMSMIWIFA